MKNILEKDLAFLGWLVIYPLVGLPIGLYFSFKEFFKRLNLEWNEYWEFHYNYEARRK